MIPQRNLSILSNQFAREEGKRIPEAILERDYCLSWFLVGLSGSPLRKKLAPQMTKLPEFDRVYRVVRRALRQAGLSGR